MYLYDLLFISNGNFEDPLEKGASYFDLLKTRSHSMMMCTFYCGDTTKFNWKAFLDINLEAHRVFNDIGEPLSDSKKILYLKYGICSKVVPESSREASRELPDIRDSFDKFTSHLTESVTNRRICRKAVQLVTQTRQLSANAIKWHSTPQTTSIYPIKNIYL